MGKTGRTVEMNSMDREADKVEGTDKMDGADQPQGYLHVLIHECRYTCAEKILEGTTVIVRLC